MNLTAAKITTSHFLDLEDIMQSTDIDADDVSFIERARVLERDLRSTLLQTGSFPFSRITISSQLCSSLLRKFIVLQLLMCPSKFELVRRNFSWWAQSLFLFQQSSKMNEFTVKSYARSISVLR